MPRNPVHQPMRRVGAPFPGHDPKPCIQVRLSPSGGLPGMLKRAVGEVGEAWAAIRPCCLGRLVVAIPKQIDTVEYHRSPGWIKWSSDGQRSRSEFPVRLGLGPQLGSYSVDFDPGGHSDRLVQILTCVISSPLDFDRARIGFSHRWRPLPSHHEMPSGLRRRSAQLTGPKGLARIRRKAVNAVGADVRRGLRTQGPAPFRHFPSRLEHPRQGGGAGLRRSGLPIADGPGDPRGEAQSEKPAN